MVKSHLHFLWGSQDSGLQRQLGKRGMATLRRMHALFSVECHIPDVPTSGAFHQETQCVTVQQLVHAVIVKRYVRWEEMLSTAHP